MMETCCWTSDVSKNLSSGILLYRTYVRTKSIILTSLGEKENQNKTALSFSLSTVWKSKEPAERLNEQLNAERLI